MKRFLAALFLFPLFAGILPATTHTIVNSGLTFVDATLTIELGDTVVFDLENIHTAVEVSLATWNSNNNTPLPGGFSVGFGGGTVVPGSTGLHYYVCGPHAEFGMKGTITVNPVTGVGDGVDPAPRQFSLTQNFPNPFNPSTEIAFSLARTSFTEIAVYDGIGRRVKTLVTETLPAGEHSVAWDGTDEKGRAAVSGPYFIRMSAGPGGSEYFASRKILLLK